MTPQPKLDGDLGQRYVVSRQIDRWTWEPVGWSDSPREAEAIERHVRAADDSHTRIIDRREHVD